MSDGYLTDGDRSELGPWNSTLLNATVERIVRRHRAEAWAEGVTEGRRLGEWNLVGLRNPYREEES